MIKSILGSNQYMITLRIPGLIGYWSVEVHVCDSGPLKESRNHSLVFGRHDTWFWRFFLTASTLDQWLVCFADTAWLISQLEPIVPRLNEGSEMGGSLSKGTATGSICEFIRQLTCSHQYLLIITGFCWWRQMLFSMTRTTGGLLLIIQHTLTFICRPQYLACTKWDLVKWHHYRVSQGDNKWSF